MLNQFSWHSYVLYDLWFASLGGGGGNKIFSKTFQMGAEAKSGSSSVGFRRSYLV